MGLIAIACGLIVALGALGASIGIAMVGWPAADQAVFDCRSD